MDISEFNKLIFNKGNQLGYTDMEVYYCNGKSTAVKVKNGNVDNYFVTEQGGVTFRGTFNGNMGCSFTEKLTEDSVDFLLKEAIKNSQVIETKDKEELYEGASGYEKINNFSDKIVNLSPKLLIEAALKMEKEAYSLDPRIDKVIDCSASKYEGELVIKNTKGLDCHSRYTSSNAGIYLNAREGEYVSTDSDWDYDLSDFNNIDVKKIAQNAANKAIAKLGGKSIKSGNYPVIFQYDTASILLGSLISNFSGEVIQKGFSKFCGKLGKKVADEKITIIEDPLMKNVPGSASFDAEGYPTKRFDLVKEGMLLNFLHNRKTAKIAGTESTGNAQKNAYKSNIYIGPHNVYLRPGDESLESLIKKTKMGILIVELQGINAGINSVSGDFSLYCSGFMIEDGKKVYPVNQIVVSGNMFEILYNIDEIANDIHFKGSVSSPSVKIKSITISGK